MSGAGTLYVVATPLGNLEDVTRRALRILGAVSRVACEDTRRTRPLLTHFGISARCIPYHEHNRAWRGPEIVGWLLAGEDIALVTDAGTPGISDPGQHLVCLTAAAGVRVVAVPGPSALAAAVSVAGFPAPAVTFGGFVPAKGRRTFLERLGRAPGAVALYESPRRLAALLAHIAALWPERPVVVIREMTKVHEETWRGTAAEILGRLPAEVRGEVTLVIGPPPAAAPREATPRVRARVRAALAAPGVSVRDAVRRVAAEVALPKRALYREALRVRAGRRT